MFGTDNGIHLSFFVDLKSVSRVILFAEIISLGPLWIGTACTDGNGICLKKYELAIILHITADTVPFASFSKVIKFR